MTKDEDVRDVANFRLLFPSTITLQDANVAARKPANLSHLCLSARLPHTPMTYRTIRFAISFALLLGTSASVATAQTFRFATYNTSLNQCDDNRSPCLGGGLEADLANPAFRQGRQVAEIIQRIDPDIILLNEFNYDAEGNAADLFQQNFLSIGQHLSNHPDGPADPIEFPYRYLAESNTGIHSGFDLDRNGEVVSTPGTGPYAGDAFGFGEFEGRYGMLVLSKYPIDTEAVRTFQNTLWKDVPDSKLPNSWYSPESQQVLRLSSKSHWDVPVQLGDQTVHVLASHPTPPVFDGPEDRNGRRNHDEIRLWADYIDLEQSAYLTDDAGVAGGLTDTDRFVIMGDLNADAERGDSFPGAIEQLLDHPRVDSSVVPMRPNGATHTATFGLRVDYVLPSNNMEIDEAGLFWPDSRDPLARLLPASDHRLVWADIDLQIVPEPCSLLVAMIGIMFAFHTGRSYDRGR